MAHESLRRCQFSALSSQPKTLLSGFVPDCIPGAIHTIFLLTRTTRAPQSHAHFHQDCPSVSLP